MAENFKTIFEAESHFTKLIADLETVNKKYGQATIEINKQEAEVNILIAQEKKLLDARSRAHNPTTAVRLTKELDKVRLKIAEANKNLKETDKANKTLLQSSKQVTDQLQKAFGTTVMIAAKKQITGMVEEQAKLKTGFNSVSEGAKTFLKDTVASLEETEEGVAKTTNAWRELKKELLAARSELTIAEAIGDPAKIQEASEKVDDIKDRMELLRLTGSKLERIPLLFRNIAASVVSFDFGAAKKQSEQLVEVTKSLNFGDAIKGAKDLGSTLVNMGKSLLLNPIFLLGAVIYAAVSSFDSLREAAKRTAEVMESFFEAERKAKDETLALIRANRLLATEIEVLAQREYKVTGERSKIRQKFIAETLDAIRRKNDEESKLNKQAQEARDEDGFRATKNLLDFLGYETKLRKEQREGIINIEKAYQEHNRKLAEQFRLETQKATEEEIKAQKEKIISLNKAIADAASEIGEFKVEFRLKPLSKEQITKSFDLKRAALERERQEELRVASLEFADEFKKGEIIAKIKKEYALKNQLLTLQEQKEIIDAKKQAAEKEIEIRKYVAEKNNELLLNDLESVKDVEEKRLAIMSAIAVDESLVESEKATIKFAINNKYYEDLAKLAEKDFNRQIEISSDEIDNLKNIIKEKKNAKLDTTKDEQELFEKLREFDVLLSKSTIEQLKIRTDAEKQAAEDERAINDALFNEIKASNEELARDEETQLTLRKASNSRFTLARVHDLQNQIDAMIATEREFTKEYRDLLAEKKKADQQYLKEVVLEWVDAYATVSAAVIEGVNKQLQTQIDAVDKQSDIQEKRVEEAKNIADKGNAEMLEAEEKRLEDLNRKREKFVRAQQQLATIELISNTAITVSKAAAEGGVAAGATIAAALIALVAGLASARAIASQAAYFEGGYTGDGNPHEVSNMIGGKRAERDYVWHKEEFVVSHQPTRKLRGTGILEGVNKGHIDLRNWEEKVKMYDMLKHRVNERADVRMDPIVMNNMADVKRLEAKLDGVIKAIQSQPGMKVSLTREGIVGMISSYEARQDLIKELAGGK